MRDESTCLPPALAGDKGSLSAEARKEIQSLVGARPRDFLIQVLVAWLSIATVIALAVYIDSLWMTLLTIVIVGTRMNILGLLVHEQAHSLGLRGKYAKGIANILVAYPLGITVEDYASVHFLHHKHFLTENDPDLRHKSGSNWTFPMSYGRLAQLFLRDLTGLSLVSLVKSKRLSGNGSQRRRSSSARWVRVAFYVVAASLFTYLGAWHLVLICWILPLATIFPAVIRISAICEHIYSVPPAAGVVRSSPLIVLRWWEKLIIPDLNFKLHVYHHFFPGIAFVNLPKVHDIFRREQLVNHEAVFYGIWAYIKYLQSPRGAYEDSARDEHHRRDDSALITAPVARRMGMR